MRTRSWPLKSSKSLEDQEPTEEQVTQIERERMATALKAVPRSQAAGGDPGTKRSLEQVIDEQTPDQLFRAGFDAQALEKAKSMLTSFRQFIEDNKDEIEALKVLYSQPYRAGLKFRHVKELASKLNQPPFYVDPNHPETLGRLWQAYELVEPKKVRGKGGKQLVDVIALVRHAIDPSTPLAPVRHDGRGAVSAMDGRETGGGSRRSPPISGNGSTPSRTTSPAA